MDVGKVRERWEQLRSSDSGGLMKCVGWVEQITKYDPKTARKLYNFREYLKRFIMKRCNLCDKDICTICNAVGSTKLTSDIDISINTELNFSISIKRLLVLRNALRMIFDGDGIDTFFHHHGKFKLRLVNDFFDINFYLSNFELVKDDKKEIDDFDRYYISGSENLANQYYFAIIEIIMKIRKVDTQYLRIINELDNVVHSNPKPNPNVIVNYTSALSLYEDGSYHTQGSYFHIVMMIQKKITFKIRTAKDRQIYKNLLSASIIENLCYSYIYTKKQDKYLSRVKDGLDRLKKYKNIFENIKIEYEIHRILHKLSIDATVI
jgi:hypothetical protein